eukprot:TRINITY_DN18937_c0_g2_i2.p2 TRINITY_DN18937_c0_g2~~TRINITY_DN18937_c0_g2_i2.p2  ORF type:complete len:137 (+),score=19.18 TRINITY_DN18937_c0_g2_i2:40-450(+)
MHKEYRAQFDSLDMSSRSMAPDLERDRFSMSRVDVRSAGSRDGSGPAKVLVKTVPTSGRKSKRRPGEGLLAKLMVLKQRHGQLQEEIDTEMQRPLPDPMIAQRLKRIRLRIKDEIECIAGVLRTVGRPVPASLSAV